jgi:hypothetical protein
MFRKLVIAAAIAATAISAAPSATADDPSGRYPGDVPGMNYDANLNAPCDNTERFIFGRGRGGEVMQCHWIPNQWPPVYTGFWISCPNPRGAAAQSPDGIALVCTASYGWVQWV